MSAKEENSDIASMTFEEALGKLEGIVSNLERGDVALEESIHIYERGEALKKHCEKLLNSAENKVEKIRLSRDSTVKDVEPLDSE